MLLTKDSNEGLLKSRPAVLGEVRVFRKCSQSGRGCFESQPDWEDLSLWLGNGECRGVTADRGQDQTAVIYYRDLYRSAGIEYGRTVKVR